MRAQYMVGQVSTRRMSPRFSAVSWLLVISDVERVSCRSASYGSEPEPSLVPVKVWSAVIMHPSISIQIELVIIDKNR